MKLLNRSVISGCPSPPPPEKPCMLLVLCNFVLFIANSLSFSLASELSEIHEGKMKRRQHDNEVLAKMKRRTDSGDKVLAKLKKRQDDGEEVLACSQFFI